MGLMDYDDEGLRAERYAARMERENAEQRERAEAAERERDIAQDALAQERHAVAVLRERARDLEAAQKVGEGVATTGELVVGAPAVDPHGTATVPTGVTEAVPAAASTLPVDLSDDGTVDGDGVDALVGSGKRRGHTNNILDPVIPHSHELCDGCIEDNEVREALRSALSEAERERDAARGQIRNVADELARTDERTVTAEAERDEARALADGLTTALAERETIEAALRERLARYEALLRDAGVPDTPRLARCPECGCVDLDGDDHYVGCSRDPYQAGVPDTPPEESPSV